MKIVILDGYGLNPGDLSWEAFEALGDVTLYDYTAPEQAAERMRGAEAVITNKTVLTRELIAGCGTLRHIGVLATGYNVVDLQAAAERGIPVTNVPAYSTDAVAQHVFALLLELTNRVGHHNAAVQEGRWQRNRDFCFWDYPLMELKGKTMGIIGLGQIGRATAELARAFGMEVIAASGHRTDDFVVPMDELLRRSDVISLHCPLRADNKGLINRDTIAKMKDGVILINTARGPLVDEAALREALLSGKVSGAAVDVLATEPPREGSLLTGLDNCIITPHIAWASKEARGRLMAIAAGNLQAFQRGERKNVVN